MTARISLKSRKDVRSSTAPAVQPKAGEPVAVNDAVEIVSDLLPDDLGRSFILHAGKERTPAGWRALLKLRDRYRGNGSWILLPGGTGEDGVTDAPPSYSAATNTLVIPITRA